MFIGTNVSCVQQRERINIYKLGDLDAVAVEHVNYKGEVVMVEIVPLHKVKGIFESVENDAE